MDTPQELLEVATGRFQLRRYPLQANDPLRAWDAADELILAHLAEQAVQPAARRTLILNDNFGALAIATHAWQPMVQGDSFIAQLSTRSNLAHNGLATDAVTLLDSLAKPPCPPELVLIKIPKTLALLEHQLLSLRPLLSPDCQIVAGSMVKGIQRSTLELFERCIGPTHTSLAKKKARLVFATLDPALNPGPSPYPSRYQLENTAHQLINHANVFSREKLDIGTRLLLQHLPSSPHYRNILDLGCGNGVVGLLAAERNPQARVTFRDESFMAVASAEANFRTALGDAREACFEAGDCASAIEAESLDLVLNNPPFHQQNAVGDHIARRMFRQSRQALRKGGELWVIGNRHLGYHAQLKKLFGNCSLVASNPKFVVLKAVKV